MLPLLVLPARGARVHRVAAVALAVTLLVTGAALHRFGPGALGRARQVAADLTAGAGIAPPYAGELAPGRPLRVRTGGIAAADLRCRAWTDDGPAPAAAALHPVVTGPDGGAGCVVTLAPADMVAGRRFAVQLVRVDESRSVVGEYRPVVLRWSYAVPHGD